MAKSKKQEEPKITGKVITLQATVGEDDERSLESFIEDTKAKLSGHKRVTVLNAYYLAGGRPVLGDGTDMLNRDVVLASKAHEEAKGSAVTEAIEEYETASPSTEEPEQGEPEEAKAERTQEIAQKVGNDARLSMKKEG